MLKIISLILLLGTSPVLAQIAAIQGHSFLGGTQAVTSGLKSSNYMQGIVPYATICVYNTGTTAPATIYANASGAPLSSCFTSNASISTDPGGWIFWADTNQGYDVWGSGGIPPNAYPDPIPLCIDCFPSTQIISGCGFGTVCLISQGGTGATTAAGALANLGVGTWGTLNYPTWVSGTPFVKMTAAGTFALDTNTYGTVTSVALKSGTPNLFSGTPGTAVTGSGYLDPDAQLATQSANCVVAGPTTGSAAAPTCRSLVSLDIPNNAANTSGNAATASIATNIAGGTGYEILVQTGANTTGFVTGGTGLLYQSSAASMPIITSSPYVTANANPYDASSQAANDLYVQNAVNLTMATSPFTITGGTISFNSLGSGSTLNYSVTSGAITTINSWMATGANYLVGDVITPQAGNYDAMIRITAVNGSNQPTAGTILYGGTGYGAGTAVAGTAANTIEFTFLLSGTLTSNATLIMAHGTYRTQSNQWIFANNTTGAYTVTVCVGGATDACAAGGRTVVVPQGTNNSASELLQTDGELNVDQAIGYLPGYAPLSGATFTGAVSAPSGTFNSTTIPASSTLVTTTTLDNATLPVSATSGTFSGIVAAGTATPTTIGSNGVLLNGVPALQAQTSLNNYYSGGAGNLTGTGSNNNANGYAALYANTTGYDNTANGLYALAFNTTGYSNTANGFQALYSNTTGSNNTANGFQALYSNTTGYSNTANGLQALFSNTTGYSNTANGYAALYYNTTGSNNNANGIQALYANTTGNNNIANGYQAGQYIADGVTANQTSNNSVYEGYQAYPLANGDTNENVIGNGAIGHGSNTTTLGNSSITDTYLAGIVHGTSFTGNAANVTGTVAIAQGGTGATTAAGANLNITGVTQTGTLGTSSQVSTFPGTVTAGTATPTTIGSNGVSLNGVPALQAQTSLNNYYSGGAGNMTGTGSSNNANGYAALASNTTGFYNTANGFEALFFNTIGVYNTANGMYALFSNTAGYSNTANGYQALYSNTTGFYNTANGYQAGRYIADGVTANQTSNNSVYEGYQAYPLANGDTNENVIGNGAIGHGSNTTTLGNSSITDTYLAGTVHGTSFTGNAATATTSAALSVPLAHAIIFPDPNAGAVYTASQVLGTFFSPMAGTVPAGGTGTYNGVASTSVCKLTTAATASTTFTFADNGTSFGTVAFAASGTTGTFTISSAKSVSSGDKITLTAPATADTTAAGLNCSLVFAY